MRIAITGHTKNLGLAIYNHMISKGHDVRGFSRSNGYDVIERADEIIEYAKTCDIFFNNAHCNMAQGMYIHRLAGEVKIVTSGSMAAQINNPDNPYFVHKRAIEKMHVRCKRTTSMPMLLLRMGYLESYTDRTAISYSEVLGAIDCWIDNPRISLIELENQPEIYANIDKKYWL